MDALKQYTDLYDDASTRTVIDGHAPSLLNDLRPEAREALAAFGRLPRTGDEGFARSNVEAMFAPDYGLNLERRGFPVELARTFRCDVPNISTLLGVVVNDSFRPTAPLQKLLPEGVEVMSLAEAARTCPDLVAAHLNRLAANSTATASLNTLLLQDGVFIHIGRGVKLDKAIQIVSVFNAPIPYMALRRFLVIAEEDTSARILLCDHSQRRDVGYMSSAVSEVFMGRGASLEIYEIEESSDNTSRMAETFVRQEADSRLLLNGSTLVCGHTRNSYVIDVDGDNAETHIAGMAVGAADQTVDNAVTLRHHSTHSLSRQMFKYVLFDRASGAFEGRIVVDEGATHTDAAQTDRNLLASPDARMHTEPQLEIYCDEVKCSHGATTGQLDARALFYMQTRGIPEAEARMMLIQAFMADVIDTVALDALRDRLRMLVDKRLSGAPATCSECNLANM